MRKHSRRHCVRRGRGKKGRSVCKKFAAGARSRKRR